MLSKKGYIISPMDMFKGILIGIVIGAVLTFLLMKGIIPNPLAPPIKPR